MTWCSSTHYNHPSRFIKWITILINVQWKQDLVTRCASVIISTRSARALLSSSSAAAVAVKLNQHARCSYPRTQIAFSVFYRLLSSPWPHQMDQKIALCREEDLTVTRASSPTLVSFTRTAQVSDTDVSLYRRHIWFYYGEGIVRSSCRLSRKQNTNTSMTECLYPCIATDVSCWWNASVCCSVLVLMLLWRAAWASPWLMDAHSEMFSMMSSF